jgi:hypothetical protein
MRKLSFGRKYKNQKFTIDGITFDSIREAHRYEDLKELQEAGIIQDLKLQVEFILIPTQYAPSAGVYKSGKNKGKQKQGKVLERKCSYIADFVYRENGEIVVEDVKGMRTKDYVIKRKLMLYFHGIKIKEV